METYRREMPKVPRAICFGGTHYPEKFTKMVLQGEYALGTIVPKHSLEYIDEMQHLRLVLLGIAGVGTIGFIIQFVFSVITIGE